MNAIFTIAAGGAIGAVVRYLVVSGIGHVAGPNYPFGTIAVNVLGAILTGFFIELSALVWSPSPEVRAMIVVGFLGSFTTFSAFSLDVYYLFIRGSYAPAALYVIASLVLSVGGLLLGLFVGRVVLT